MQAITQATSLTEISCITLSDIAHLQLPWLLSLFRKQFDNGAQQGCIGAHHVEIFVCSDTMKSP
jgi:hypothetical protein